MSVPPYIVGFYSFKGGVGRTMALANVAYFMARRGRNVLVVDLDMEAPGLGVFLKSLDELGEPAAVDVIDLLAWANTVAARDGEPVEGIPSLQSAYPPIEDYTTPIKPERLTNGYLNTLFGPPGRIDLIGVDRDRSYYERLISLRLSSASQDHLNRVGAILRGFFKACKIPRAVPEYYGQAGPEQVHYDYVLLDSRTGITEVGGLCFGPLTDRMVVLTGLNYQNIDSTVRFLKDVGIDQPKTANTPVWDEVDVLTPPWSSPRLDPKPTLVVASPVPAGEIALKRERLQTILEKTGVPIIHQLSYNPHIALREAIFARDYPEEFLTIQYSTLCDQIFSMVADHPSQLALRVTQYTYGPNDNTRWRSAVESIVRLTTQSPEVGLPFLQQLATRFAPRTDEDYRAADRMFRILTHPQAPQRETGYRLWGNCLLQWSQKPSQVRELVNEEDREAEQRLKRYRQCLAVLTEGLSLPGLTPAARSSLLFSRARANQHHKDYEAAIEDYSRVIDLPDGSLENRLQSMLDRGLCRGKAGQHAAALGELTALTEIPEARVAALVHRGIVHGLADDPEKAIEDYTVVINDRGEPTTHVLALRNRGVKYLESKNFSAAIDDFTAVIMEPSSVLEHRLNALHGRASANRSIGKVFEADVDIQIAQFLFVNQDDLARAEASIPFIRTGSKRSTMNAVVRTACDIILTIAGISPEVRAISYYNRGYNFHQENNLEEAAREYSKVIELEEQAPASWPLAMLNRAVVRAQQGDNKGARMDLEKLLAKPGLMLETRARVLITLATAKSESDDLPGSIAAFDTVLAFEGVSDHVRAAARAGRGWCAYLNGDFTATAHWSREAVLLDPTHPLYRANLALAMLHLDDIEGATREYKRALVDSQSEEDLDRIKRDLEQILATISHRDVAERILTLIEKRRQEVLS
jgi:tetratricopeptide (TPR) repeat protein/MinD-like ATPase involved in chromosome partitioning or flagellar assembly